MLTTLVCLVFAAQPINLEAPAFKLEAVTVNERIDPKGGFFSETSSWTEADLPTSYIQHYLVLDAPETKVALGMETKDFGESCPPRGMNPKTLQVQPVGTSGVLAVSWKTHMVWGGRWQIEALVILQRGASEWKEVFRDYHQAYYRAGAGYFNTDTLSLEAESKQTNAYMLTMRSHNVDTSYEPKPMYQKHEQPGQTLYILKENRTMKWPCMLENGRLVCAEGTTWMELGDDKFPIDEVAAFLLLYESKPPEAAKKVEELRAQNPQFANVGTCTGSVKIETVSPFVPHPEHKWTSTNG